MRYSENNTNDMIISTNKKIPVLKIGKRVNFDFSAWEKELGNGAFQLWHKPQGEFVAHREDVIIFGSLATGKPETLGEARIEYRAYSGKMRQSNVFAIRV